MSPRRLIRFAAWATLCVLTVTLRPQAFAVSPKGEMDLTVLDAKTKQPIAVRLRIEDKRGKAPVIRDVPRLGNDFTFRDLLTFKLKKGLYRFTVDRGPHYQQRSGVLEVNRNGFDQKTLELPRFVDVHKEGWYSGDLMVARKRDELDLLMDAEELDFVVAPTWHLDEKSKAIRDAPTRSLQQTPYGYVDNSAGIYSEKAARLLAIGLTEEQLQPATDCGTALEFAAYVSNSGGNVHVLDPAIWDLPLLVAANYVSSIAVLTDALQLDGDQSKTAGRRPKDARYRGQHGLGRYAQAIYFHLLNTGHRIAPAAHSNSGDSDNPPGYSRVYVACGQDFSAETWWENLQNGRCVVSNGPVLRAKANGQLPGYVFEGNEGSPVTLTISCNLGTRQKVEYLEIIQDGLVTESVRLDEWAKAKGKLPPVTFERSGWLAVRAYAPGEKNYRAALTAPFYVDIGTPTISKKSAQFFLDWTYEYARAIQKSKLPKSDKVAKIQQLKTGRNYWQGLLDNANAR